MVACVPILTDPAAVRGTASGGGHVTGARHSLAGLDRSSLVLPAVDGCQRVVAVRGAVVVSVRPG